MINTRTDFLNGLPIQSERTPFRLTDDEISVILNKEYCHPMENHLTNIPANSSINTMVILLSKALDHCQCLEQSSDLSKEITF